MKKRIILIAILALSLIALAACNKTTETPPIVGVSYEQPAKDLVNNLLQEKYEDCIPKFTEEMKTALPSETLKSAWEKTIAECGTFVSIEKTETKQSGSDKTVIVYCAFEKNGVTVAVTYDKSGLISGLWFNYYELENKKQAIPSGIEEIDVTLNQGTEWELKGKISKQKDKQSDTAIVLVQGSGPSDMDETIYSNKPFRDIAWGLAEQGIDTIRCDKRTFTYGQKLQDKDLSTFTVEEETIQDAIAAAKLLKEKGYSKIYLAGHSLGGMLAPRIEKESGGLFTGLILLAGSPRSLIDIISDQNEDAIAKITDTTQIEDSRKLIDAEKEKFAKFASWSDEELKQNTIFGMPAYYVKDLINSDTTALAKEIDKPILVLQGGKDFQVYVERDFNLWKEVLKDSPKAQFILYPELNHLFMLSTAESKGTVEDYKTAGKVDQKVIDDIAAFVKNQ